MYTKAIELNPLETIYHSNRAKTLKKLNKLDLCLNDCIEAIETDT